MKSFKELIKQPTTFCGGIWSDKIGVISDFEEIYMSKEEYEATSAPYANVQAWNDRKAKMADLIKKWEDINILFAFYQYEDYSGEAFLLFEQGGKLFEVSAWHCSCYGLEGQFEPSETTLDNIRFRLENGTFGNLGGFRTDLINFLGLSEKVEA